MDNDLDSKIIQETNMKKALIKSKLQRYYRLYLDSDLSKISLKKILKIMGNVNTD